MQWYVSHPTRVRGLKCVPTVTLGGTLLVAPYAGAWIEIAPLNVFNTLAYRVAPYAGAWIEIMDYTKGEFNYGVAPYAGAWIEMQSLFGNGDVKGSHPTRVRGLKLKL